MFFFINLVRMFAWADSRDQTLHEAWLVLLTLTPLPDLSQGPKKIRDPGFAESKVWDLDGSWTLHVLFFVGLWKPRTSKF